MAGMWHVPCMVRQMDILKNRPTTWSGLAKESRMVRRETPFMVIMLTISIYASLHSDNTTNEGHRLSICGVKRKSNKQLQAAVSICMVILRSGQRLKRGFPFTPFHHCVLRSSSVFKESIGVNALCMGRRVFPCGYGSHLARTIFEPCRLAAFAHSCPAPTAFPIQELAWDQL